MAKIVKGVRRGRSIDYKGFVGVTFTPLEIFVVSVAVGFIQLFLTGFMTPRDL